MKDVVVGQEEEVVGVVESLDVVLLALEEGPAFVKLVDDQCWLVASHTWLQPHANQALCVRVCVCMHVCECV